MIFLERLGEKDLSEVHKIQKLVFENLYSKYKDKSSPFIESKSFLLEKIKRPNNYFYFIRKDGKRIGYARIMTNDKQTKAKIGPIGILPKNEDQGLGTETMFLIEREFPTVKKWYLDTILQEYKLIHFYTKLGYKKTGETEKIQKGMDIVFFIKQLEE